MGELWKNHRNSIGAKDDDASPTAGNEDFLDASQADTSPGTDGGAVMSDSQMRVQVRRQRPGPRRSSAENHESSFETEKVAPQPRDFASDYISPLPPGDDSASSSSSDTKGSSVSGESAWDRVRRQNAPGGPKQHLMGGRRMKRGEAQQEQQDGSTLGESSSFSFSSKDERSYAKDEAQKQFDERVERERRGEDFEARGSRRW